jgi:CRP-like cAMP-binding protein
MASKDAVKLLKKTPLFNQFTEDELEATLRTAKEREFNPGTTIVKEGDTGGLGFYLILEGQVEVRKGNKSLAKWGSGDFFGEMSLLLDTPRTADVVALEKTRCVMVTRWDLRALISTHPDMALKMQAELARRLLDTNKALSE